jgi:hypothetical protein
VSFEHKAENYDSLQIEENSRSFKRIIDFHARSNSKILNKQVQLFFLFRGTFYTWCEGATFPTQQFKDTHTTSIYFERINDEIIYLATNDLVMDKKHREMA